VKGMAHRSCIAFSCCILYVCCLFQYFNWLFFHFSPLIISVFSFMMYLSFLFLVWCVCIRTKCPGIPLTGAGKANDSGYFALLASGSHPRHILSRSKDSRLCLGY